MALEVEIVDDRVEFIDAAAILLPVVNGAIQRRALHDAAPRQSFQRVDVRPYRHPGTDMTFAEEFARNQGQPIVVDGQGIVGVLRRSVRPGERIRVIWRIARETPVQGVCMKVKPGKLLLGEKPESRS